MKLKDLGNSTHFFGTNMCEFSCPCDLDAIMQANMPREHTLVGKNVKQYDQNNQIFSDASAKQKTLDATIEKVNDQLDSRSFIIVECRNRWH